MKLAVLKIFLTWGLLASVMLTSLVFPHKEATTTYYINSLVQLLLFVTSLYLVKKEPTRRNRFVFLNFTIWLGSSILFHVYHFVPDSGFLRLYFFQYGIIAYYFLLASSLGYLVVDMMFRRWRTSAKYFLALSLMGGLVLFYFKPFLIEPLYIYSTQEARDYTVLQEEFNDFVEESGRKPSINELVSRADLPEDVRLEKAGLNPPTLRVATIYPYLLDENSYVVLLVRPIYLSSIYVCILCLGLIVFFFGYQYLKDPPQGAYVEKMMFLFLIFCTMEVLHNWSYVKSIEWYSFYEIMHIGQAISIGVLLLITVVLLLRLRFIISPNGAFYEQEIATSPGGVTRWRDMFDELIITHFINNSKHHVGRIFVDKNQVS